MSELPPVPPASPRPPQPPAPPPRDGRPVSFYLAIFLALLLFVSGGLNLLLLVVSAFGSATAGFAAGEDDGAGWEIVEVAGDRDAKDRLLEVRVEGAIAEQGSPLIGARGGSVTQLRRALRFARRDDRVKGVLIDIDSPGGGVTDSDEMWRLLREFREDSDKPVLALLGDVAASGGYYLAVACDRIIARPTTITGSIGVIVSSYNVAGAAEKLGVTEVAVTSGPHKDMLSPFRAPTEAELGILQSIVDEMYDRFVEVVVRGRPELDEERVRALADGRIYSAKQARDAGLVDDIGTIEDARSALRVLAGVDKASHVEQRRRPTLGEVLFGMATPAPSWEDAVAGLLGASTGSRLLYYWPGGR